MKKSKLSEADKAEIRAECQRQAKANPAEKNARKLAHKTFTEMHEEGNPAIKKASMRDCMVIACDAIGDDISKYGLGGSIRRQRLEAEKQRKTKGGGQTGIQSPKPKTKPKTSQTKPQIERLGDFVHTPDLPAEMIEGKLRVGRLMLFQAKAKTHKSWAIWDLAKAMIDGGEWLGETIQPTKFLYVDFELGREFLRARAFSKMGKMNLQESESAVLSLREVANQSYAVILPFLEGVLGNEAENSNPFECVILDPISSMFAGYKSHKPIEENSNGDVIRLMAMIREIATSHHTAIIAVHHFAKGDRSHLASLERGSGAGAFGRSADAICTLSQLEADYEGDAINQVDWVLRDFRGEPSKHFIWDAKTQTHIEIDLEGIQAQQRADKQRAKDKQAQAEQSKVLEALGDKPKTLKEMADALGISRQGAEKKVESMLATGTIKQVEIKAKNGRKVKAFQASK